MRSTCGKSTSISVSLNFTGWGPFLEGPETFSHSKIRCKSIRAALCIFSSYGQRFGCSRFAYKSIRLHRGRFAYTTKLFRLHGLSRFAYTYKSKCFVKMDEHHCLQLAEELYLTVFLVKFLDIITIMFAGINMFWARLRLILALA